MLDKNNYNISIKEHLKTINSLEKFYPQINRTIKKLHKCLKSGNKILICGNGGSAADAQHLSAEFLIRLRPKVNRRAYPVISLALDTSTITACGNDYSFDDLFLRNFTALYKKGDILMTLSTSGNSKNILKILNYTSSKKIFSVGFLGNKGGKAKKYCSESIIVPSENVARIQEAHIFLGHYIFEQVENLLLKK
jgi:D-sedoheptulose 7-phosphate isomerase|tara:strand:+ start:44 stop:625 length:582 start_codon:yes stop_codon:yes gene_type:complete